MGIVGTRAKPSGKFGCACEIGIGYSNDHDVVHAGQHADMPPGDASSPDKAYSAKVPFVIHAAHIPSGHRAVKCLPFPDPSASR